MNFNSYSNYKRVVKFYLLYAFGFSNVLLMHTKYDNVIDIRTGKPVRELSIATPLTMRVAHLIMQEYICMCGWQQLIGKSVCQDCPFPETVQSDPDQTPDGAA